MPRDRPKEYHPILMAQNDDITMQTLLQHMQGMEQRLMEKIEGIQIDMKNLEHKVDRGFAQTGIQIDNIDKRLDAIEIEQLPKRVTKLEAAMGMSQ